MALGAVLAGAPAAALAADATVASGASKDPPVEELIVTAKRNDIYNVLPTRKTGSAFDLPLSLAETPRSITLIEQPIISLYGIRSVDDFVNITPGTFTGNYFGVPGELTVRGDLADNFFRGFRRVENPGNFPTTVTAADYVEIIKGPPPIPYGGGKVGGILNFVLKGPTQANGDLLDQTVGLVSVTGGSYNKRTADVEVGTPFSLAGAPSAIYASVNGEDSDSYYHDIYTKNLLAQVSAKSEFSSKFTAEYGFMGQWSDLNQNLGWNRVTQALIDSNGKDYLAGRPALNLDTNHDGFISPSEAEPYGLSEFAFANPFPYYALSPNQRAAHALDPNTVHIASLSHQTVMAESTDYARTSADTAYFDLIYQLSGDWTIKNQSFYDQMLSGKYSSYGFTADYRDHVFENKTTLSGQYSPNDWLKLSPVVGFSWREVWGLEKEARDILQAVDRRDLTVGATGNDRFEGALDGMGAVPWNWYQDGSHSDLGGFGVLDVTIANRLTAIVGGRWDDYHVRVHGTDDYGNFGQAKDAKSAGSYNASLSFKVTPLINAYATYASSQYVELGQGGMIGYPNVASKNWVQPSNLFEAGLKGYLLDGELYFNALYYDQKKSSYDVLANQFDWYESKGEEIEAHYAASKRLSFIATATFQSTELLNAPYFNGIPPSVIGLDPALTYGGKFVGLGSLIGFNGPTEAPGPRAVLGLTGTYTDPRGWGMSLGATHSSSMYAGFTHSVVLPQYTVVRAAIFYNTGKWSFQANANNILNAQYFLPQNLFGDVLVLPSEGPTVEATIKRRF
jgi:iron complex outermembrane receptor protein